MLLSFGAIKVKTIFPRKIYEYAFDILNKDPNDLTLDDFNDIFDKFDACFEKHFQILKEEINALHPKMKPLQKLQKIKELVAQSSCLKCAVETGEFIGRFVNFLGYGNFTKHFVIIAEMLTLTSSYLERIDDLQISGTVLSNKLLSHAHLITSYLCACLTNEASKFLPQQPQDANCLFEKAIIYGELCLDYHDSLMEFPQDASNDKNLIKITTETLGFLAKSYVNIGNYSLALQTLLDMHSHLVKFKITQTGNIFLFLRISRSIIRAIFGIISDENNKSIDILMTLQQFLHLTQRYQIILLEHKLDSNFCNAATQKEFALEIQHDMSMFIDGYLSIIKVLVINNAVVENNIVLIALPLSIPTEQIEKEICKLKMIDDKPLVYAWQPDKLCFVIKNLLYIDLVTLGHFNVRVKELRNKFTLSEERLLLKQYELARKQHAQTQTASAPPPAVCAAQPPESQAESAVVDLVGKLSIKKKKTKTRKQHLAPQLALVATPAPIIKYGKDFGFNEPPFADAICHFLRKGVYVLYTPGQFAEIDPGCDPNMQARFELLAANPCEARKVDCNGFKMWPTRTAGGQHAIAIEGKLTTSPLRLLASKSCTNSKGETAYYFDTIKNTKKGKKENRYKAKT